MDSWRHETQWQVGDSVLLCEANVPPSDVGRRSPAAVRTARATGRR